MGEPGEEAQVKGGVTEGQAEEIERGEFVTISEIANKLNYSRQWITVLVQQGYIQGIKPLGGQWRIPRSELDHLLKEGIPPTPRTQAEKPPVTEIPVPEKIIGKVIEKEEKKAPSPSLWPLDFSALWGGKKK